MSKELLPCPFCKSELEPWGVNYRHPANDCILFNTYVYVSEIDAWNRRAQPERKPSECKTGCPEFQVCDFCQSGSSKEDKTAPERKLTDAAPAPTRLDVMSLIHSQMHRVYASAIDREEVDTQYMHEIEDAIRALEAQPAAATVPDGPDLTKTNIPAGDVWGSTLDQLYAAFHREPCGDTLAAIGCAIQDLQAMQSAAQWISVEDRLPDDDVEVLINGSEGVEIARYVLAEDDCPDSMGHDAGWCGYKFAMPGRSFGAASYMCHAQGQPTHWMPLPQPPAAQAQDDGENK